MTESPNPLRKYGREPGIYIRLPTQGYFYPSGSVQFTANGEIPILPMTSQDEKILKNPDALMNGDAVLYALHSCCPTIDRVIDLATCDMDAILLAMRAATYGDVTEFTGKCPQCGDDCEFGISNRGVLDAMTQHQDQYAIKLNKNVIVYLRPQSYSGTTKISIADFEQRKLLQQLTNMDIPASDKERALKASFDTLTKLNFEILLDSISHVVIPEGDVTDRQYIAEWFVDVPANDVKKIETAAKKINSIGVTKETAIQCQSCGHEWSRSILFDPAYFFV